MKSSRQFPLTVPCVLLLLTVVSGNLFGQTTKPLNPEDSFLNHLKKNRIVMLGEAHESRQLHEFLLRLIASPSFARELNDIVVEGGNPLFQPAVDRYVSGDSVAAAEVQKFSQNGLGLGIGSEKPGREFFAAVRYANKKYGLHLRIVSGDAPVDWPKVSTRADLEPFVPHREEFYAQAVRDGVLNKNHRALLIMGLHHFRRKNGQPQLIEAEVRKAGINPWLVLVGSDIKTSYEDVEPRFRLAKWPSIYETRDSWVGELQATGPLTGGTQGRPSVTGTLEDACDAFLFLGPRETLTQFRAKRRDVQGTAQAREMERRLTIIFGRVPSDFLPKDDREEWPLYLPNPVAPPPIPDRK
jgi:hypothetical protein